jgi:adenine-specific DNA-methyltransferase
MQNLLDDLKQALEKDERLLIEGQLNKALIEQKALALEKDFLKLIQDSDSLKKHFSENIDETLVFDKVKFQQFIHNKSFLPDSSTAFKNKIGLSANGNYLNKSGDVVLAWPHKDCVLEGGQDKDDAKRVENFWNEELAPDDIDHLLALKVLTNWKKYDKGGEQGGISNEVEWKGGGSFGHAELKKSNQLWVENIQTAENGKLLLAIWEKRKGIHQL